MNYIIGLLVVVFLGLTIAVIARLQGVLKGVKTEEQSEEPEGNKWNAVVSLVFLILGLIGSVWSYIHAKDYFLPEASSVHGRRTDDLFWFSMALLFVAFIVVNFLIFFFAWKYRYKKGNVAKFYPDNHKLELIWTVIPAIVMATLVITGYRAWTDITSDAPKDAEVIEITGKQFGWIARYGGVDNNKLGNYNYKFIDPQNEVGIDLADENSFDDFTNPSEMHIPANRPVLLKIRARDVLHSVFIPHMRVKMDAVPGMPTKFWFVADKTTAQMRAETGNPDFNYEIACAEICGQGHFGMKMTLVVDDEATYRKWVSEQKTFLATYPDYISRVPENLKAKALKYVPAAPAAPEAPAEAASL